MDRSSETFDKVKTLADQIKQLQTEARDTTGEVRRAYQLICEHKIWQLKQLVGKFWIDISQLDIELLQQVNLNS